MAGVSLPPPREVYLELARRIQIDGGKVMTTQHKPAPVTFEREAVDAEARAIAEKDAFTCGCGDTRMVMIPYVNEIPIEDSDEVHRVEKRYIACVNCDAVHLQPRWTQGRFKGSV
jgi:hypothetical protein